MFGRRKTETEFLAPSQVSRQVGHTPSSFGHVAFFIRKKSRRNEHTGEREREGLYRSGCVKISAINFPNTRRRRKVSSCEYLHKFKPKFLPTFQGGKKARQSSIRINLQLRIFHGEQVTHIADSRTQFHFLPPSHPRPRARL